MGRREAGNTARVAEQAILHVPAMMAGTLALGEMGGAWK
jgi:hypothetical protein